MYIKVVRVRIWEELGVPFQIGDIIILNWSMFPKCVFRWGKLNIDIKLVYIVVSVQLNTKAMMTLD